MGFSLLKVMTENDRRRRVKPAALTAEAKIPMTKLEQRLASARQDLSVAEKKVAELDKMEADAFAGPKTYASWLADRGAMLVEADRLRKLVSKLEVDCQRQVEDDARAAVARRRVALEKTSTELARKIREDGGRAAALLRSLAIAAAENEAEIEELNRSLPKDIEPLQSADFRARWREPAPRKVIEEAVVYMWAFEETGELVGAQDEVIQVSPERGHLPGAHRSYPAIRRPYRQVRFHPREDHEPFQPLHKALRLPHFLDGGSSGSSEPAERPECIELKPVPVSSPAAV